MVVFSGILCSAKARKHSQCNVNSTKTFVLVRTGYTKKKTNRAMQEISIYKIFSTKYKFAKKMCPQFQVQSGTFEDGGDEVILMCFHCFTTLAKMQWLILKDYTRCPDFTDEQQATSKATSNEQRATSAVNELKAIE